MGEIYIPSWIKIILVIQDTKTLMEISKKTNITYCHVSKIIKILEKYDLIKTEKKGRELNVDLTNSGKKLYLNLNILSSELFK